MLFQLGDFFHAAIVPAIGEFGREKNFNDLAELIFAEQVSAQAQDVAMIVLAGAAGGDFIVS